MMTVGMRELRQNPTSAVAHARGGEVVLVTDRGEPVVQMIPVPANRREMLIAVGALKPSTLSLRDVGLPTASETASGRPLSETLAAMRDEERY
jgi:prevent-host-death family protein